MKDTLRQAAEYWEEQYNRISEQEETFPRTGIAEDDQETASWLAEVKEMYHQKYQKARQYYIDADYGNVQDLLG
jgi:hypothetical protein